MIDKEKRVKKREKLANNIQILFLVSCFMFLKLVSCKSEFADNSDRFKEGVFEIPAGKGYSKTTVTRIDSLQIEEYIKYTEISTDSGVFRQEIKNIDTLYITWKNNFFYTLKYINPKNELQKDPMYIQINKLYDHKYDFTVRIGFSKFSQKGTVYKIE